jgi:para-aminobenzoate synthetase/4-amino-4-deoxychorismate lyase
MLTTLDERCAPSSALLVDRTGTVLETTRASLFVGVGPAAIATPPLDGRILPGLTRATVISLARELGIRVDERPLALDRLASASEMFTTGAVRGIEPVKAIDGVTVAGPGRLTTVLGDRLRATWFA